MTFQKTNNSNVSSCYGFRAQTCLETNLKVTSVSQLVFEIRWSSPKSFANDALRFCVLGSACVVVGCMSPGGARIECKPCPHVSRRIRCRCLILVPNSSCGPIPSFYGTNSGWGDVRPRARSGRHVNANRLQVKGGRVVKYQFVILFFSFISPQKLLAERQKW